MEGVVEGGVEGAEPEFYRCPDCQGATLRLVGTWPAGDAIEYRTHCVRCGKLSRSLVPPARLPAEDPQ